MTKVDIDIDLTSSPPAVPGNGRGQVPGEASADGLAGVVQPPMALPLPEASFVGSSWDLLSGLDVVESEPGELFDEFFDSASGAAREFEASAELSKDQWLLAFAVELAELDEQLEPQDVIRIATALWRNKQHLAPRAVARDVYSTGWMVRRARQRENPQTG